MADPNVNMVVTVATNVAKHLAAPMLRELGYLLCVTNVIDDLEDEKKVLTEERDYVKTRIEQAKAITEVIEEPVERWLSDVEKLLEEVEVLLQRKETGFNCFQGWLPMWGRYLLCKQMVKKLEAMGKFKGKSNDIQPFSHLDSLPGIQYESSEDFIYFGSTKRAYDELFETLEDDSFHMIGLYGEGGCGKTSLVTEVGKKAEDQKMFDKVISITVSQTPNIRGIQGEIADMLKLKLKEESPRGRAQRIWTCLETKKRILVIVDDLWSGFNLMEIGIRLDNVKRRTWKILVVTRNEHICTLMDCQKMIHLGHLSNDESWTLFQKLARIDDKFCKLLDDVPQKICNECKGVLIAIKTMASSLRGKNNTEWKSTLAKLVDAKAFDDHEGGERNALNCIKLSYDCLQNREAELLFLMCCMFPEDYHIPTEDLTRYAIGLVRTYSFQLTRSLVEACINRLLESCLLMRGSVKMHNMVRDAALWISNRSDNCKILVNVDKPLSSVAEDNRIRDCFAVSSWWFNENPSFCQLHAPNLKMLLVNISAHSSLNSLDLSPLTFEGIQGLEVFSLTIKYKEEVPLLFPPSIQLLKNVRTLRLNGLKLGDISFIASLISLEVLDLRSCKFKELPIEIGKLISLKLLDLSDCHIYGNNYKGEIGKCSQLEELYASKCYSLGYVREIILDIGILLNLQRFVFGEPIIPESTRAVQVYDFNISKLTASNKNILQIAEAISLSSLQGGCKSIVPDMVGAVGGMNNLSTLHLKYCKEIECIFDTTYDLKQDDSIPMLVELRLKYLENLIELCHGPPQQVLHYFEKLELLYIDICWNLHIIFPSECKLQNLKILCLSCCKTDEVLFSESVAQSLQQLEELTIEGCDELKHIIASSGSDHDGCDTSEEIVPAPMNSPFLMSKLRNIDILKCKSLESIFPICYVEGLAQLQNISIEMAPKLEYVFGECDHECHSSHQYQNHVMLPHLEVLKLCWLDNLTGICPENCQAKWPSQSLRTINILGCPKLAIPWFNSKDQSQHHLNEIWSLQCLQSLTLFGCEELKCLFSMETHRCLPELMELCIYNCEELEQIVTANEELVQLPNAELYFPKLKEIKVENCNKLKSLFPLSVAQSLQQLEQLKIRDCSELKHIIAASGSETGGYNTSEEIISVPLNSHFLMTNLRDVDIFHCQNLESLRILDIRGCPKLAIPWFNLKFGYDQSQRHLNEIWSLQCLRSLTLSDCEELKCLFSIETHRSLPELIYLHVSDCQELEQIVAANEELEQLPNAELYFPKLKEIKVKSCNKLKSLFPLSMVTMLPQLSTLHLSKATQLQEVFRRSQGDSVMNELEIVLPNLTEITLVDLRNFVDICHGCKLHAVKLQKLSISNCRETASSLRIIERKLTKEAASEDDEDSLYQYPISRMRNYAQKEKSKASKYDKESHSQRPSIRSILSPDHRPKGKMLNKANKVDDTKDISKDQGRESLLAEQDTED